MSLYRSTVALMLLFPHLFAAQMDFKSAVEQYIRHNPELESIRQEIDKTKADSITAHRRPNPVLLMEYQYLDPKNHLSDVSPSTSALATVHLDYPIELGGKRERRIANATETVALTQDQVNETQRQKLFDLIDVYYQIEEDKTNLFNANANRRDFDNLLQIAQAKYEHGFLSLIDLQKLRLLRFEYDKDISASEASYANDREQLAFLLAVESENLDTVIDQNPDTVSESLNDLISNAQHSRPDCLAASQNIKVAESDIRLQTANAIPDITVGGEYETYGPNYEPLIGLSASIPLPIYDRNKGEIEKARIRSLQAQAENKKIMEQAAMEVRQAYMTLQTRQKLYRSLKQGFQSASDIKESQEKVFALKGMSILELIDVQKSFREYQKNLTKAKIDLEIATQQLKLYSGIPLYDTEKGI